MNADMSGEKGTRETDRQGEREKRDGGREALYEMINAIY